jgi:hypothetical protein
VVHMIKAVCVCSASPLLCTSVHSGLAALLLYMTIWICLRCVVLVSCATKRYVGVIKAATTTLLPCRNMTFVISNTTVVCDDGSANPQLSESTHTP